MCACYLCVCNQQQDISANRSLHKFPVDPSVRALWLRACNLDAKTDVSKLYICRHHFKSEDFVEVDADLVLKPRAVPSLFISYASDQALDVPWLVKPFTCDASTMTERRLTYILSLKRGSKGKRAKWKKNKPYCMGDMCESEVTLKALDGKAEKIKQLEKENKKITYTINFLQDILSQLRD